MISVDGYVWVEGGFIRGHAYSDGSSLEISEGPLGGSPDIRGIIVPSFVDCHTHCADAGARPSQGMSLEELVAPPDGLKHRYLRETPRSKLVNDMCQYGKDAFRNGVSAFIDFREGGVDGCRMLRESGAQAAVYGRPSSAETDPNEIRDILTVADGIAISSVSDIPRRTAEMIADVCRKERRPFALHASERVREDIDFILSLEPAFVVHMTEATAADMRACAENDVPIVACPRSNAFFGKTPNLALMMDSGAEISLGTDNAMLCDPDMRKEALLASGILGTGGRNASDVWNCLFGCSKKILNRSGTYVTKVAEGRTMAVLPFEGSDPLSALRSDASVTLFRREESP
ncbi:Cytosine deaminase-related metal-dependent hydrolase [Thermoplasmatales archaeon BRNA1]|nr:Cytosine deaminase-related metal-dependent hydrolase [Thermoplasmatales archaeon BRNA1]